MLYKDALCICEQFETERSGMKKKYKVYPDPCIGFTYKKIEFNKEAGDVVIKGMLHGRVYEKIGKGKVEYVIGIRHQEGDGVLDQEQWEAMGLWGRNFMALELPDVVKGNSWSSLICDELQKIIFRYRRWRGIDFISLGKELVLFVEGYHEEFGKGKDMELEFTGYSMGGAVAQYLAYELEEKAIVFGANGILDIQRMLYDLKMEREDNGMVNIFHEKDKIPKMDCQVAEYICTFKSKMKLNETMAHEKLVYGSLAAKYIPLLDENAQMLDTLCMNASTW